MRKIILELVSATAFFVMPFAAEASSLQVSPISVDIPAPGATSTITLSNAGADEINAQVRVFKWTQVNGVDQLVPTTEVVASPPAVKIVGNKQAVVRIVRLSKTPISSEETYRLKVDEIPKPPKPGQASVAFVVSYSLPVFFTGTSDPAAVTWTATIKKGQLALDAVNTGGQHSKLTELRIAKGSKSLVVAGGLAGYVLGKSTKQWLVKSAAKFVRVGDTIKIIAKSNLGPVEATVHVVAAN